MFDKVLEKLTGTKDKEIRPNRSDVMTDEQIQLVDGLLDKIKQNIGHMGEYYERWESEEEAYRGDQVEEINKPNVRVNIVNAQISGQVAALTEQNIAVSCRGEGPSDQGYANWARVGLEWALRQNHIKRKIARHEKSRELFGPGVFKLYWDPDAINGFGLPTITVVPLNSFLVDMKITDIENLQQAEYIAEIIGPRSKAWAIDEYDKRAYAINYGSSDLRSLFTRNKTQDDEDSFYLIQVWTKTKGKLRLLEISDDGILLYDSFEDMGEKPFYRYNKYPYWVTNMYEEEGKLFGFGDGKLLKPLQDWINQLYDQIIEAAKPNLILFDPASEVDVDDLDISNGPVPCIDPNRNVREIARGNVNNALWQLLNNMHIEVQRVTRFSELMQGQSTRSKSATESAIQQQQGGLAVDFKKMMVQETLQDVAKYMLDMMMEKYEGGRMFRIDEDKEDYEWIDFRQMDNVPVMRPATQGYIQEFGARYPDAEMPKWEELRDEQGNPVTKSVDLDIEITIGAGLPKNKVFLYQMLQSLSALVVEGRNVITWDEIRKFAKDFLGLPLEEAPPQPMMPQGMPPGMPGMPTGQPPAPTGVGENMPSADTMGMAANGSPQMMMQPPQGGGFLG